ncbi:MAG: hypothetical protein A3B38_02385 [Candidatus Levybacteria bacterium RIFCSPLOWO2_01_FULL_36_13]|nr:MAG: hypothetical protein A2684_03580 [Candidatus Levybacteria bacterium RIFCSPHIGHO2_01_FULL_36_15b]OGH35135.1 MAG: hypothetical protein A3B38_02385 [Candidatus Levybacteria bacterium RIFCSPLOWO2_01_FULL_36_13]
MNGNEKLTKAQKKALQKTQWTQEAEKAKRNEQLKTFGLWGGVAALVGIAILGLALFVNKSPSSTVNTDQTVPLATKYDFEKGPKDSKVTLIEYGDYQCPACASYHPIVNKILADYKNLHFVYRFFPLSNIHKNAEISAKAAYAANVQGKFFEMHNALYENQNDWSESTTPQTIFVNYAQMLGLDTAKFTNDLNSTQAKAFVADSEKESISAGLNSTPSFYLNGARINPNSYEDFKKLIDDAFKK